jgi:hypothetical protein
MIGSRKETKIQQFMSGDIMDMEHETCGCTSNNWSHQNSNKWFKENLEAIPGKHSMNSLQKTVMLSTSHKIKESIVV